MRKSIFLLVCFLVGGFSSCKKYLNTTPRDFNSPEEFYQTEAQLNSALAGVYNAVASVGTFARNLVVELATQNDETYYKRTTLTVNPILFNHDPSNSIIQNCWSTLYDGINRANYLIANIDRPSMSEKDRQRILGEALFLRAFMYFQLVTNWGDVPLLLTPTTDGEKVNIPRTPQREVYAQILQDMTTAKDLVGDIRQTGSNTRVTKTAVEGQLARVCLKMAGWPLKDESKYAEARAWADSVITSGAHALAADYAQIFINHSADVYDIKENIWELEFTGNAQGGGRTLACQWAPLLAIRNTNPLVGYGYALLGATGKFYNSYEPNGYDLRRDWNVATFSFQGNNTDIRVAKAENDTLTRDIGKWRREFEKVQPYNDTWGPTNYPVLRYSDVLLMWAEADNEINKAPSPQAIEYVNQVRRRGFGKYLNGASGVSESIKTLTVVNQGTGYTAPVTITFVGGGTDAAATATISGGKITAVTLTNRGKGYPGNPIVTVSGGAGSGAVINASITPHSTADVTAAEVGSYAAFKSFIMAERSRELCFEGNRNFDLKRWETYLEVLNQTGIDMESYGSATVLANQGASAYFAVRPKHLYLPIPSADLALDKALVQNPGW